MVHGHPVPLAGISYHFFHFLIANILFVKLAQVVCWFVKIQGIRSRNSGYKIGIAALPGIPYGTLIDDFKCW